MKVEVIDKKTKNKEVDLFLKEHNMTLDEAYEYFRNKLLYENVN
jgi:hypothetical protein